MSKNTIMLVCSAGMSTSLLVTKMKKAAEDRKIDLNIFATSVSESDSYIESENIKVVLLGPQVRFMEDQFKEKLSGKNIALSIINMSDYGMMNGEKVLDSALKLMGGN
ncbi:PTS sugar transporter subunit IIB [Enterococcus thailandicus]|uniref:PTS sugar transporter subunit IIB n=1 Tax=Enterococcus thailandicus TaxID=417368 RepID=UPI0022E186B9|nr:PTS sugar transporter subunit IIB [Enterococcus thailandicus]